jgi:hypothetical protein
MASSLARVI